MGLGLGLELGLVDAAAVLAHSLLLAHPNLVGHLVRVLGVGLGAGLG